MGWQHQGGVWGALLALSGLLAGCNTFFQRASADGAGFPVTGYWHNWQDAETGWLPLEEIPAGYRRVIVSFALPEKPWTGAMRFRPDRGGADAFRQAVEQLQSRGTEVLLAIGGSNHPIELHTEAERDRFVTSLCEILTHYGFDGLDVNLEGRSLVLDEGDLDFREPTTPKIVHLIAALREIKHRMAPDFLLTFAPETVYTVGGYARYGGAHGGYLPVLHALRDELDAVHLQLYNSGSQYVYTGAGEDDRIVEQGTVAFVVDLTRMLAQGFPVARHREQYFEGLGGARVFAGLPAHPDAAPAGGYLSPDDLCTALRLLSAGGMEDGLPAADGAAPVPAVGGVMFWSINWDARAQDAGDAYPLLRAVRACGRTLE